MSILGSSKSIKELMAELETDLDKSVDSTESTESTDSAVLPSVSRKKLFEQIGESGERYEEIEPEAEFEDPSNYSEIFRQEDTRYADLGNIGGEFAQTPSFKDSIVRSVRKDIPIKEKKKYRNQLPSLSGEIDHIIPLWLGGSDRSKNFRAIPKEQHRNVVTRVQKAVEYLYRNPELSEKYFGRKLSLAEARNYAINAPMVHEDAFKGLEFDSLYGDVKGKNLEDQVKKSAQILNRFTQDPEDIGILDVLKPKKLREAGETAGEKFGEWMPDTMGGEFAKGLVSGITLGHITYAEENPDMAAKEQLAGMVGNVVGGLTSLLVGGWAIKAALGGVGAAAGVAGTARAGAAGAKLSRGTKFFDAIKRINPNIAKGVQKFIQPNAQAIDVKSKKGILSKIFKSKKAAEDASDLKDSLAIAKELSKVEFKHGFKRRFLEEGIVIATIGQLSKQEDQELSTRAKRLATDLALGGLTAKYPGGLSRNLAKVWVGSGLIETIAGASPAEAATNATIMTLFHGIGGFRNSGLTKESIDRYSYEVASKTRNKWLGQIKGNKNAIVPDAEFPKDGNLSLRLKELSDTIDAETDDIKEAIRNSSLSRVQQEKEIVAAELSGRVLLTKAMPEDMRGSVLFEDMKSMAERLAKAEDSVSTHYKNGKKMSSVSTSLGAISDDAETSVVFTTKGVDGTKNTLVSDEIGKATVDGVFSKLSNNRLELTGDSQSFLVKLPDIEAKSVEGPNPAAFGETDTIHSKNVYELQVVGSNGRIYHLGMADESVNRKIFNDLRSRGSERIEAKIDFVALKGESGEFDVHASISKEALERVDRFNAGFRGDIDEADLSKKPVAKQEAVKDETSKVKADETVDTGEIETPKKIETTEGKALKAKSDRDAELEKLIAEQKADDANDAIIIDEDAKIGTDEEIGEALKRNGEITKEFSTKTDAEVKAAERKAPVVVAKGYTKAEGSFNKSTEELTEIKRLVKDDQGGGFHYAEGKSKSEVHRNKMRAKFKKDDINRAVRFDVPNGTAPKGIEIAMGDETLLNSIEDTAFNLHQEGITPEKRKDLISQANRFKDELINHREIDKDKINKIARKIFEARYSNKRNVDPTINRLMSEKVKAGMSEDQAMRESVEDMILHEMAGKPLPKVKEMPTESQLDLANRIKKIENQRLKEIDTVEDADSIEIDTVEMENVKKELKPSISKTTDTPFIETARRIKAQKEGKIVKVRGQEPTSLEPTGKPKMVKDAAGDTETQAKIMSQKKKLIDDALDIDRPKDESPEEYRTRVTAETDATVFSDIIGQSKGRERRANVNIEGIKGKKELKEKGITIDKFHRPFLPGKPSGAYVGYGEVLRTSQIERLRAYRDRKIEMNIEEIKRVEPTDRNASKVTAFDELYNPEYVNKMIDGGTPEEAMLGNKINISLIDGEIDGTNNEIFAIVQAHKTDDQSYIMKNNVVRYLKKYSHAAEEADDIFDMEVAKGSIGEGEGGVNRDEFIRAMVDIENAELSKVPDHIIKLDPVKEKIMSLDPTVEFKIKDLVIDASEKFEIKNKRKPNKAESAKINRESTLKALKEAKNRDELDIEIINKGNDAFDEEVKNNKIIDTKENREHYLDVYFHADGTGASADIMRLDSIKKRLKVYNDSGVDPTISKAGETEFKGKNWGTSPKTIKRLVDEVKSIREGNEPTFTYKNAAGDTMPVVNPLEIHLRIASEESMKAGDKTTSDFYDVIRDQLNELSLKDEELGKVNFSSIEINDLPMMFDSLREGSSGMNRHVKMTDTQRAAYMWGGMTDFLYRNFDVEVKDTELARKLTKVQEIAARRRDENILAIQTADIPQSRKDYLLKGGNDKINKTWLTIWTKPEPSPNPLEINLTNLGRAVDRLETDFGKSLIGSAKGIDEVRAVEDYLGSDMISFLDDYPHLKDIAEDFESAIDQRVSLEHFSAKEQGYIGKKGPKTPEEIKLEDEMELGAGADETFGYADDLAARTKEYSKGEISLMAASDPDLRSVLEATPDKERRIMMEKMGRIVASDFLEAAKEVKRSSDYKKTKRLTSLIERAKEYRDAKTEQRKLLKVQDEKMVDMGAELDEVKKRIAKMEKRPYKTIARENRRYKELQERAETEVLAEDTRFTKKHIEKMKRELDKRKANRRSISDNIKVAKEKGDLKENAEYHQAKSEYNENETEIAKLKRKLAIAKELPEGGTPGATISFGDTVTVSQGGKEKTYRILSKGEADPASGSISSSSPLGKALLGKTPGSTAEINVKIGLKSKQKTYKILSKESYQNNKK